MNNYLDKIKNDELPIIKFDKLSKFIWIDHGFTTRIGGVSKGIFSSLNLSFSRGDNIDDVFENYRIIGKKIGYDISDFVASDQTHTTNIKVVTNKDKGKGITLKKDYSDIDGFITKEKGIVLFTYFADCVPLFFADPVKKIIALSHSGWKGTVNKMGQVTVNKMVSEYNCKKDDIVCAIGPSICKKCYEISRDVADEFIKAFSKQEVNEFLEEKENGKFQLDLWKANEIILINSGIKPSNIENKRICTCCNKDILFSHRGLKGKRGNLAAFMVIK